MVFLGLFLDAAGTLFHLTEPVGVTYSRVALAHSFDTDADALERGFRHAWKQHHTPLRRSAFESAPADDDRSWWRLIVQTTFDLATGAPVEAARLEPLFTELYHHYATTQAWTLFPDVLQALDRLSSIAPLHMLSNFDLRLNSLLKGLGIAECFQTVTLSSQAGASKPHPHIFAQALQNAGISAHTALHIGDEHEADLLGATRAGMFACLLDRPTFDLAALAEKLHSGDDSCLQAPLNGVINRPQFERG